ncbi:alpha-glucosidase family protein [Inquilinus limosus]|uniref:alpha-glucosidase family protein n=1 Tax=Inquilinus limosus TaxID=171674 RepID=UPI000408A360|nr:alpha-glucosidase family protein [Inquilinus limosus]
MREWWRGAVMYQIYPRSFLDTNGDGIGDLAGITAKLDYIADLGVDGIWISPFFKSPMKDFGYDVSDYRDVDPMFGTLQDFDRLVEKAHALGLKVIIDQVISHTSDQHPWFAESRSSRDNPKADWFIWANPKPDGNPPNNWLSIFGGSAWQWDTRRRQYYMHNFLVQQPDLNLHNPEVQEAVLSVLEFWLQRGADGFRLDTANFYMHDRLLRDNPGKPADRTLSGDERLDNPYYMQFHQYDKSQPENMLFLRRMRALMNRYPDKMAVAEIGDDDPIGRTAEYVQADLLHTAYNFSLLNDNFSAAHIAASLTAFEQATTDGWPSWAFSNHDVRRVLSRWGGPEADPRLARLLIALLTSLRGTAFLYQGEELGLPEAEVPYERLQDPYGITFWPEFKGRDGCRTPMPWEAETPQAGFSSAEPWLPIPDAHRRLAVSAQAHDPDSTLAFTRQFLRWRRTRPAFATGSLRFLDTADGVLAFERRLEDERILCVFNLTGETRIWTAPPAEIAPTDAPGLGARLDNGRVALPPYAAFFGALAAEAAQPERSAA